MAKMDLHGTRLFVNEAGFLASNLDMEMSALGRKPSQAHRLKADAPRFCLGGGAKACDPASSQY